VYISLNKERTIQRHQVKVYGASTQEAGCIPMTVGSEPNIKGGAILFFCYEVNTFQNDGEQESSEF
jgi:hypothetical protein